MASKKKGQLSKYCRIFQWIEAQDPDFANAIRQLCLEGALSPGGRSAGVTFLYPKEKSFRDEITDMAYTDDADDAATLIESLIIPDAILTAGDFRRAGHPVGNRLGVQFIVEPGDGPKIKLSGGVELEIVEEFQTLNRRTGTIAVWNLVKGRPPTKGASYKPPTATRKRGGNPQAASSSNLSPRAELATNVEREFHACMEKDRCAMKNPYVAKMAGLKNFLKSRHPDLLLYLLPLDDACAFISFYTWLEPYKTSGPFMIPDSVLFGDGAWNGAEAYGNAVAEYLEPIKTMSLQRAVVATDHTGTPAVPFVFADPSAVMAAADGVRQSILHNNDVRRTPDIIRDVYVNLVTRNTIDGVNPIYPDGTLKLIPGTKKLWLDQFRFVFWQEYSQMKNAPVYTLDHFRCLIQNIREKWTGDDYSKEAVLTTDCRKDVAPRSTLIMAGLFVKSTDFLAVPRAEGTRGGNPWGTSSPVVNLNDWSVYDSNPAKLAELRTIGGMVRSAGISPEALQELQIYAETHSGSLPPAVLSLQR
jgi:hypothetical protein